jgi:hypothetical protein
MDGLYGIESFTGPTETNFFSVTISLSDLQRGAHFTLISTESSPLHKRFLHEVETDIFHFAGKRDRLYQ